ncbi:TetR/AcrR family transcriptional regulator [Agrococcus jejuensis]|uniref:DNA-binding transcriptional regulator, AcrR family n=1 Tax=Agrococcus jejuensis TaxID=399736 RepID=A0A1G8G9W1_9MICO|nr:TetR/AcrR family transcriptional regulator [Agrococcus jejuensis]SDH91086.1 DNA-binding transcriptional regulator, AcrR family [Agrococcus jejuensis]
MPRLTDVTREARRTTIATSMLRVMQRSGWARLTMADVFAESGLSAGSVYSHFASKEALARYVVERAHRVLLDDLEAFGEQRTANGPVVTPAALTRWLVERLDARRAYLPAMAQLSTPGTVDPALTQAIEAHLAEIRAHLAAMLAPWSEHADAPTPTAAVDLAIAGIVTTARAFVIRTGADDAITVDGFLASLRVVVAED